jgi:ribosomal protein L7/L12
MSQTHSTARGLADHQEWEQVLVQLRAEGFSPIESIKVTRAVLHLSLGEAKQIVHQSTAWADSRDDFDLLHAAVERAADELHG